MGSVVWAKADDAAMSVRERKMRGSILTPLGWGELYLVRSKEQVIWDRVEAVEILGVDMGIVFVLLSGGVVLDVQKLAVVVVGVSYAVFVIAAVPNLSLGLLAGCEGIAALDVLDAFCRRFVYGWRD